MRCDNCGAPLSPGTQALALCPYCGAQLRLDAPERLADRDGNGVPDVLEAAARPGGAPAGPAGGTHRAEVQGETVPEWKRTLWLVLLVVGFLGLIAFFVTMQLCTAGRLADP